MLKRKSMRTKGKISFSKYFQTFKTGDLVAVVREISMPIGYSTRTQGKTGRIISKRGNAYHIEMKDMNKTKNYFIKPIHLKRIEGVK